MCPNCSGTGIACDGLHQETIQLSLFGFTIVVGEMEWVVYCGECNGTGRRPQGGWQGKQEDENNPIVASSPDESKLTAEERKEVNERGNKYGCHTCGTKNPGTKNGDWIPDHCPPTKMAPSNQQKLRPQCQHCARRQGGKVKHQREMLQKWGAGRRGPPVKPCSGRCGHGNKQKPRRSGR